MKSPLILSVILAGAALSVAGCSSKTETATAAAPTSTGAKAAASLTPGKSTVADLKMYVGSNLVVSEGTAGAAVYRYTETRPGPVKRRSIVGPIYNTSEPTTITTTHNFKFVNGLYAEYWASDSAGA